MHPLLGRRALLGLPFLAFAQGNGKDARAVEEVRAGRRKVANAAWWGFDPQDSTAALQAALDSQAPAVVVPYMGAPWVVTPLQLRSHQEVLFEPGVLVLAKKGEFRGRGDSLFTASGVENLTIRGYGATFRMHKRDYQKPPYEKAEWRMGLSLRGVKQVRVEGLRIESTGGDGFYIDGGAGRAWSEDMVLRDCVAHDNHRQGLSVISAQRLLVEHCRFSATSGTPPEAGIDLEPDTEEQRLSDITIRNCVFENNHGHALLVYLRPLSRKSAPVSIRVERCLSRMSEGETHGWAGYAIGTAKDDGPQGLIELVECVAEHTGREGLKVFDKSAGSVKVRAERCHWKDPWNAPAPEYGGPRAPVLVELRRAELTKEPGGLEFADCYVYDSAPRPAVQYEDATESAPLVDVAGRILVRDAETARPRLGTRTRGVNLRVESLPST